MSRWGTMDGVADLPERAFSENKFTRTFEGGGGGGGGGGGTYGPGMTPQQSQALATVSPGTPAPVTPRPGPGTPYAPAGMAPNNPFQQASMAQQGALAGTVAAGTAPIGTIAGSNIAAYQNPYTQQVINAQQADVMRGAQMGLNELGRQASAAGAFGGSRHGVAMSELGRGAAQLMGQQSAQLRQQGFMNAQQMAQQDIQNRLSQANLGMQGAAQLAGLGAQSFGYGQQLQQGMQQVGNQQQAMQQALIDAAKAQYQGYTQQPITSLGYVSSALGATPIAQNTQTTKQPGLFDYLTLFMA